MLQVDEFFFASLFCRAHSRKTAATSSAAGAALRTSTERDQNKQLRALMAKLLQSGCERYAKEKAALSSFAALNGHKFSVSRPSSCGRAQLSGAAWRASYCTLWSRMLAPSGSNPAMLGRLNDISLYSRRWRRRRGMFVFAARESDAAAAAA